ncbi:hypothetical protein BRSPCE3_34720 [Bradyrhizobium sp. Ce-3]|nr:hypothetical protein BRSPCE3_34720 [Bradyrhizobium sp. Ce-3]
MKPEVQVELVWCREAGRRFVAFHRDEARACGASAFFP